MRSVRITLPMLVLLALALLWRGHGVASASLTASATIRDAQTRAVGTATFTEISDGAVAITLSVAGYNPVGGGHGLHIHAVGSCVAPDYASAGGHFNPGGAAHGNHAGDLPNMQFYTDGSGTYRATTTAVTLSPGSRSLFDADGSALVIHAAPDDGMTDPAGNSGARIGCGVIMRDGAASPPAPPPPAATVAPAPVGVARAEIFDAQTRQVGMATFTQRGALLDIVVSVAGYNPIGGGHGLHIHGIGRCSAPDYASAGGHFNPGAAAHGSHAGDLPNMQFYPDGSGDYRASVPLSLAALLDSDGSALVIHAAPDDGVTDPAGNSGARIGCGVILP